MREALFRAHPCALGCFLIALILALPLAAQSDPGGAVEADRVVLQYQDGTFGLVSVTPLSTVLPPTDELPGELGSVSGFWYELQSTTGQVLYRRAIGDPVRLVFEGADPEQRSAGRGTKAKVGTRATAQAFPARVEAVPATRTFSVLIPRAAETDTLVLLGSPLSPGTQAEAADELARIPLGAGPSLSGKGSGTVIDATKLVDNGPDADRFDLVLLAEGYGESELEAFAADAQAFADFFLNTPPFSYNCSAFNIWRIDIASANSGADDPTSCGEGVDVDTFFDATFCADGTIHRLLGVDEGAVIDVLNGSVPGWDQALVLVNSDAYGGSGGGVAVSSLAGDWQQIAVHEIGHSTAGLADEYEYWAGCGVDTDRDVHPSIEPVQPNVTVETDPTAIKWAELIADGTPVPTTTKDACDTCNRQPNPFPGETVVGLYEGAHYYHCDAHRPAYDCMMRNFAPFCPVCTRRILDTLDPFQPANSAPVCDANGPYLAECEGVTTAVLLDGSASSDEDCDRLEFIWTGEFVEESADGETPMVTFAGLGSFVVDLEVLDAEASATCGSEVTVEDTLPPALTAPEDITAECASAAGTPVELGQALVEDICDPDVALTNDGLELYPLETTLVTWTATDASGNASTDTQSVTVVDTTPPDVVAPDDITVECASPDGNVVDLGLPSVSDICDPDVVVTHDAPDLFPLGTTVVTWTATDASGNVASDTQVVVVVDTTPPDILVSVDPSVLWPPNHQLVPVTATVEVSDICDANPQVWLESLISSEADNGNGDGNTVDDIQGAQVGADDRSFELRAERTGKGDGRIYTVRYVARDASLNAAYDEAEVRVPKSQGQGHRNN